MNVINNTCLLMQYLLDRIEGTKKPLRDALVMLDILYSDLQCFRVSRR